MIGELIFLYRKISDDDIWGSSASLSYYLLLSFFPFVIALVALLSFVPVQTSQLLVLMEQFLPENVFKLLQQNTMLLVGGNTSVLSIGFISAIWVATKGAKALIRSLNKSYNTLDERPFWKRYIVAIVLTLSLEVIIIISAVLYVFSNNLIDMMKISDNGRFLIEEFRSVVLYAALVTVMAAVLKFVPDQKLKFRSVIPGALTTGVIWVVATIAFGFYIDRSKTFSNFYGTLGSVIALMLWLYLISFSILFGNAINSFRLEYLKINKLHKKTE